MLEWTEDKAAPVLQGQRVIVLSTQLRDTTGRHGHTFYAVVPEDMTEEEAIVDWCNRFDPGGNSGTGTVSDVVEKFSA